MHNFKKKNASLYFLYFFLMNMFSMGSQTAWCSHLPGCVMVPSPQAMSLHRLKHRRTNLTRRTEMAEGVQKRRIPETWVKISQCDNCGVMWCFFWVYWIFFLFRTCDIYFVYDSSSKFSHSPSLSSLERSEIILNHTQSSSLRICKCHVMTQISGRPVPHLPAWNDGTTIGTREPSLPGMWGDTRISRWDTMSCESLT